MDSPIGRIRKQIRPILLSLGFSIKTARMDCMSTCWVMMETVTFMSWLRIRCMVFRQIFDTKCLRTDGSSRSKCRGDLRAWWIHHLVTGWLTWQLKTRIIIWFLISILFQRRLFTWLSLKNNKQVRCWLFLRFLVLESRLKFVLVHLLNFLVVVWIFLRLSILVVHCRRLSIWLSCRGIGWRRGKMIVIWSNGRIVS